MTEIITSEMEEIRRLIVETVAKRNALKLAMQEWYENNSGKRFGQMTDLITVDSTLSELDSHYKRLWDYHNSKSRAS
ncbi:hypothetical protein [Sulfuricurvum sp.]|uniref:hypothetical protein n=1 Tax=Sulfuricurvum sp. TaxID=2025608 RepID=UPI0026113118|nr:hypothetical protein [Sulfuricurvum sp.]MDD3596128.1 hypothetical protein [Sulfuricurvum sp.]MDD4883857.1 hypothetical protein [Sulfuricurvum sp.]